MKNSNTIVESSMVKEEVLDRSDEEKESDLDSTDAAENKFNSHHEGITYKSFTFEVKQLDENNDFFQFEGYASTFGNVDRGNDVVVKGAFLDSLKERKPSLFWQHDSKVPLGVITEAFEDDRGLFIKARMPKKDTFVSGRVMPQMEIGAINKMSIGFNIVDYEKTQSDSGETIFLLKKVNLWEVSLVSIPMNPEADVTRIKAVVPFQDLPVVKDQDGDPDTGRTWNSNAAIQRVREETGSTEEPTSQYKNAFLWYDRENSSLFGSYKLPIADVVDGELKVVPRAIFAAAAAMSGARGGVDIPDSDRQGIINNINRYYDKMGLESPLEKGFSRYIDSFSKVKDISEFLKSFGLSNRESDAIISAVKRSHLNLLSRGNHDDEGSLSVSGGNHQEAAEKTSSGNHLDELTNYKTSIEELTKKIKENFNV